MYSTSHTTGGRQPQSLTDVHGIVVLAKHVCDFCLLVEAGEAFALSMVRHAEHWSQGQKKAFSAKRKWDQLPIGHFYLDFC